MLIRRGLTLADLKSFEAVGAKVRDQYTAKNPLIADFYKQAKDM